MSYVQAGGWQNSGELPETGQTVCVTVFYSGGCMRNINDVDLSIVLGNILDNAIEAAEQAQDK